MQVESDYLQRGVVGSFYLLCLCNSGRRRGLHEKACRLESQQIACRRHSVLPEGAFLPSPEDRRGPTANTAPTCPVNKMHSAFPLLSTSDSRCLLSLWTVLASQPLSSAA